MINPENDIKRFFERLGIKISIKKCGRKNTVRERHILELKGGNLMPYRFGILMDYYFGDARITDFGSCSVVLSEFKEEGHTTGICKRCGCTNNDACEDNETGTCWWVKEDLCSACATTEEKQIAMDEMRRLSKEN